MERATTEGATALNDCGGSDVRDVRADDQEDDGSAAHSDSNQQHRVMERHELQRERGVWTGPDIWSPAPERLFTFSGSNLGGACV